MVLTAMGSGAVARFESTKAWIVPVGTSADLNGKKYIASEIVPAGTGTYWDIDRWQEIVAAPVAVTNPANVLPAGTIADISKLPGIKTVTVDDAVNGKLTVEFSGPFTITAFYGDWDFNGVKYTTADVGKTIPAVAGDKATLWLRAEFKPAK